MNGIQTDLTEIMELVRGNGDQEPTSRLPRCRERNPAFADWRLASYDPTREGPDGRIGHQIGTHGLKGLPYVVTPDTIMRWYRELIAQKSDEHFPGKNRWRLYNAFTETFKQESVTLQADSFRALGRALCTKVN